MVEQAKRTLAYICPECRQSVVIERTAFQLAAAGSELPCPCGKSALKVELAGDRAHLQVPCLFCDREHRVSCSTHAFLHQKALAFSCAASGLDCCYVGEEGPVFAATARLERAADKLKEEQAAEEKAAFLDEIVMHEVLSEVKDIAARGGVSCACGSREWKLKVNYSSIDLICAQCGSAMRINAGTMDDLNELCCHPKLTIRSSPA